MTSRIVVLVCAYDCRSYLTRALASIRTQTHPDVRVVVIDDCSPDLQQRQMVEAVNDWDSWTGHINSERRYCPRNLWDAFELANPDGNDICFVLDGDDWLPDSTTLARLAAVYDSDPDVWFTYGSYRPWPPDDGCHIPRPYPPEVIAAGSFRTHPSHEFNHPVTFRAWLWRHSITEADLQFDNGEWFTGAYDQAICLPMLERAGEHHRCLEDVLYVYRSDNPASDVLIHHGEVMAASRTILERPPKTAIR